MKDVTNTKGLGQLRTATTTRLRSKQSQKGTAHLDLYLLSKDKQRLEQELANLKRQQDCKQKHLAEVRSVMEIIMTEAQLEDALAEGSTAPARRESQSRKVRHPECSERQWETMTLDY